MPDPTPINYERIFEQTPVVRFLIEKKKADFVVIAANDMAIKFFDQSREKVIGYSIDNLFIPENSKRMTES
jgi:PAS domain-containing protein